MRHLQRFFLGLAVLATAVGASIVISTDHAAWARITRTIRIVVPYAPGGAAALVVTATNTTATVTVSLPRCRADHADRMHHSLS